MFENFSIFTKYLIALAEKGVFENLDYSLKFWCSDAVGIQLKREHLHAEKMRLLRTTYIYLNQAD